MRRLFCCGIVGAVRCLIVVGFALLVRELRKGSAMFGALSDVASEVDALRAEIGGLQWSLARARGEGDNYFHGVDAHTGMRNVPFLALSLPIGSLVDVTGEDGRVIRFVRVYGMFADEGWLEVGADDGIRSDKYVCAVARMGKHAVVRRPGLVDKGVDDGEEEPSFACVNGYTGEETSYRVSDLPVGTVILVEDENVGDVVFARSGAVDEGWWRTVICLGDECRCGAPSVDDLMPGASGRLPVVYAGLG